MILKARKIDPKLNYCADIMSWGPKKSRSCHSMEVFYYLEDPKKLINNIYKNWLNQDGRLIIGIDFIKKIKLHMIGQKVVELKTETSKRKENG